MEIIIDNKERSKTEKYLLFHQQWNALKDPSVDWISNTSNAMALLKQIFDFWWVGIYRLNENELHLGPFQGPTACTKIAFGKGVCGTSWKIGQSIIVPDVKLFEGHIACSSASQSEIVVPIYKDNSIWGVLDVDSEHLSHFDDIDKKELESFVTTLF